MLQKDATRSLSLDVVTRGFFEFLCFRAKQIGSHEIAFSLSQLEHENQMKRSQVRSAIRRLVGLDAIRVETEKRQTRIFVPAQDPPTDPQIKALKSLRRLDPGCKQPQTKEEARLLIRRLLALQKDEQEAKKEEAPAPDPTQEDEELEEEGRIMTEEELEELDRKVAEIFKK